MSHLTTGLAQLLAGIDRPGDFSAGGVCDMFAPRLLVEGVGPVALPLLPVQAEQIIAVARRAPFGRGQETVVDTSVRRTWQIEPNRVQIDGQGWSRTLDEIVRRVAEGLGVADPVVADFYKLLVYDEGAFFVGHRDTEKAPGMFGTLVIVLPSAGAGGELVVRHDGREARYDLRAPDPSQAAFAGFYADCLHEVLPVTTGCRLTLVYNLLRGSTGDLPRPPDYGPERSRLAALLRGWNEDDEAPVKLVLPLEHAYTPAGLDFAALKGADAAKAAALLAAAEDAGCELHLALLSIEESGSAEYTGRYRAYRGERRDGGKDEFEVDEVYDRDETLSEWRRPDGAPPGLGTLPCDADEISPPDALNDIAPDDQHFHEATGNEGASFERSYSRAALVLWPKRSRMAAIDQGGLPATLPYLADLAGRWVAQGNGDRASPLWAEAHELSRHMVTSWPDRRRSASPPGAAAAMLTSLCRLGDTDRIDAVLIDVVAEDGYVAGQAGSVLPALRLLDDDRAAAVLAAIVAGNAPSSFADAADLLAAAVAAARTGALAVRATELRPAGRALLDALPGDTAPRPEGMVWGRPRAVVPGVVVNVMTALVGIDPETAEAAAALMLARPGSYGFDDLLVPAMLDIAMSPVGEATSVARLRRACIAHLRTRVSLPLAPPADWARDGTLRCACAKCGDLGRFLVDPTRPTWHLRAVQADRDHVESTILNNACDLDRETLTKGRPYTLVCTKNQASYERRARQRTDDLATLARLEVEGS